MAIFKQKSTQNRPKLGESGDTLVWSIRSKACISFWGIIRPSSSRHMARITKWANPSLLLPRHQRSISLVPVGDQTKNSRKFLFYKWPSKCLIANFFLLSRALFWAIIRPSSSIYMVLLNKNVHFWPKTAIPRYLPYRNSADSAVSKFGMNIFKFMSGKKKKMYVTC